MSTLHLRPPFRAEHVGSLLRPPYLLEKRDAFDKGLCSLEDLKAAEDLAIKHAVAMQKDLGLMTITDGEFRRGMFFEGVFDQLEGMTTLQRPIHEWKRYIPHIRLMYAAGAPAAESVYCSGKIKRVKSFYVDQFLALKAIVPPEDIPRIKMTVCSPSWFHQRHGSDLTYDLNIYKGDDEYFDALGVAYRAEFKELYDLGCRYIQFDDSTFAFFCDETFVKGIRETGVSYENLLDTYIRAINVCTKDRPSDLVVCVHLCHGNFMGQHFSEGGYERIAAKLFNDLDVDVFYLEYDTERSGDFRPLRHLPLRRAAVLGLVTTKHGTLEDKETIKARVQEAVTAMCDGNPERTSSLALNQLGISPQCGFASVWQGNPITEEEQRKKLELLVTTAKEIWADA